MLSVALLLFFMPRSNYGGFTYYDDPPLSYSEAKQFCSDIGTSLATILTDTDRYQAVATIIERSAPWIGLEHYVDPSSGECYFHYPAENDPSLCPVTGKCVDFWVNDGPSSPTSEGYECALYYPLEHNLNGGVDNDVLCDTPRPFLCHTTNQICDVEDFECGTSGIPYEAPTWCGSVGVCACESSGAGPSVCVRGGPGPSCDRSNGDSDCAEGYVCISGGCGPFAGEMCMPLCGEDTRRRLTGGDEESYCRRYWCPPGRSG